MRNLDFLFLRRRQGKSEGFGQCPNVGLSGPVCVCSGGEGGERTGAGIQGERSYVLEPLMYLLLSIIFHIMNVLSQTEHEKKRLVA